MKKNQVLFILILLLFFSCSQKDIFDYKRKYLTKFNDVNSIKENLYNLANENTKGLYPGTNEFNFAADYIAYKFDLLNLKKAPFLKTYFQNFSINTGVLSDIPQVWINNNHLQAGKDYIVSMTSGNGNIKNSELVFVGFGISNGEDRYDDYKSVNVENKVVIAFKNLPKEFLINNPEYSNLYYRSYIAKSYGAKGIIYLDSESFSTKEIQNTAYLPEFIDLSNFPQLILPFNRLNLFLKEDSINFTAIRNDIISSNEPYSFSLQSKIAMSIPMEYKRRKTMNIIGYLPANIKNPQKANNILFTTHLDGMGKQTEKIYYKNIVYNTSSVLCLLNLAEKISSIEKYNRKNNIYFVIFSGKEKGLIGGKQLLDTQKFSSLNTRYMIKLSNIGASSHFFELGGGLDYPKLYEKFDLANKTFNIKLDFSVSHSGYAEEKLFAERNIPSLYIYSPDLKLKNTLQDSRENLNFKGINRISKILFLATFDDIFKVEK
ncbi:MAG: M28 family peptidase [Candidatus Mcinerneyibacterium aminivorans]|uniref:M28 family peptidase n=1 Tax=Candidatus Mcinerneyibacterium aminivorans TaxID=2703815 RepID=A0A5D0MIG7_9BACT|nr:MAG: M28 family peptidase [Candidatus Mcinerneyibacterium aminivorans]